jgi:predicted RNA-binding Zn-ribbon protein involved in translation (DUF1610 family)
MAKKVNLKCSNCGEKNEVSLKKRAKGSIGIEIVLWLCFFVPGILYSLWRMTTKATVAVCPNCGKTTTWDE